jgi:hypothetical protein
MNDIKQTNANAHIITQYTSHTKVMKTKKTRTQMKRANKHKPIELFDFDFYFMYIDVVV